jgi:hypothetical protein
MHTTLAFIVTPTAMTGTEKFQVVIGYTAWLVDAIILVSLLGVGAKMTLDHKHGEDPSMNSLGRVILAMILAASAATLVGTILGFNLFTSTPGAIPGLAVVQDIINWAAYVCIGAAIVGVLYFAGRMAVQHRRQEPLGEGLALIGFGVIILAGAGTITTAVLG